LVNFLRNVLLKMISWKRYSQKSFLVGSIHHLGVYWNDSEAQFRYQSDNAVFTLVNSSTITGSGSVLR
jgi:hypothetical protein